MIALAAIVIPFSVSLVAAAARERPSLFPLASRWTVDLGASPVPSAPPVADASRVYVALRTGTIVARALADGAEIWKRELVTTGALAVDGGFVFASGGDTVFALHSTTGQVAWEHAAPSPTAPLVARSGWLLVTGGGRVTALRAADGSVVWQREVGAVVHRAEIDGDQVFVPVEDGRIVALDIRTGAPLWERTFSGTPGDPTAAGDRLYFGASDRLFYCVKRDSGEVDWTWRVGATVIGAAAVDTDNVYFVAMDNVVRALDRVSGVQQWQHAIRRRAASGPAATQGVVLLPSSTSAEIYAWDARGKASGTIKLSSPPVVPPVIDSQAGTTQLLAVTGSLTGVWEITLIARASEPPLVPITEWPGRPLELKLELKK